MEQPKDMTELLRSVLHTAQAVGTTKVIPTIATHQMVDLPQSHRAIASQMLALAQVQAMSINSAAPGTMAEVRQTDEFYRSADPNGHARRLISHVEFLGVRSR